MRYQAPRGCEDVLPSEAHKWHRVESAFRDVVRLYGYEEIRTPTFEDTQLFLRTAGETSDIVSKQMYSFLDKGGRDVTLKSEGTAPAMRALIEHGRLGQGSLTRVYYVTPVFRYERPQKGRLREHHQVGIELIGSSAVDADAETIEIAVAFYKSLGLKSFRALINSIGRAECRAAYQAALLTYCEPYLKDQDEEARDKALKNPLRLLDSKDPKLAEFLEGAPSILNYLEPESASRFSKLQSLLSEAGIDFEVDPRIVRGLDYYTETVFELQVTTIGAQSAIGGGGRYDNLIAELDGPPTPSVGFGIGIERAILALEAEAIPWRAPQLDAFIAVADAESFDEAKALAQRWRSAGVSVVMDYDGRSLKSQFKLADKLGCRFVATLGADERASQTIGLRDMATSVQESVAIESALTRLRP